MGKFYVIRPVVDTGKVAAVLAKMEFVPFRVEYLAHKDEFEYIGVSSLFAEIPIGFGETPTYTITVNDLNDEITVTAERV